MAPQRGGAGPALSDFLGFGGDEALPQVSPSLTGEVRAPPWAVPSLREEASPWGCPL